MPQKPSQDLFCDKSNTAEENNPSENSASFNDNKCSTDNHQEWHGLTLSEVVAAQPLTVVTEELDIYRLQTCKSYI